MFDGIFEIIEKIFRGFSSAFEKGWLYIGVIAVFFISLLIIIIILVIVIKGDENIKEIPIEKQIVISNALDFCFKRNYNSWAWANESNYTFICVNSSSANISIEKFAINAT